MYGKLSTFFVGGYVVLRNKVIRDYPQGPPSGYHEPIALDKHLHVELPTLPAKQRNNLTFLPRKKKHSPLGPGCLVGLSLQWVVLSPIQPKQPGFFSWLT